MVAIETYEFELWDVNRRLSKRKTTYVPSIPTVCGTHILHVSLIDALCHQTQNERSLLRTITSVHLDDRCGSIRPDPLSVDTVPRPLHLHHKASTIIFDNKREYQSSVFRIKRSSFVQMAREQPQIIQDIFRNRHILVYECDPATNNVDSRHDSDAGRRDTHSRTSISQGTFRSLPTVYRLFIEVL